MIDEKKAWELIAQGEGQYIEFKANVPSKVRELSEEVCAFANASGGFILIGITDRNTFTQGFVIDNAKRSAIQNSLESIEPEIECDIYPLTVEGHSIWVIEVPEGFDKPYFVSGAVYVRRGANSQKLRKPADIRQLFDEAGALHYDEAANHWFTPEEISAEAVREFKEKGCTDVFLGRVRKKDSPGRHSVHPFQRNDQSPYPGFQNYRRSPAPSVQ